jgi:hypothetical protein
MKKIIIGLVVVVVLVFIGFFMGAKKGGENNNVATTTPDSSSVGNVVVNSGGTKTTQIKPTTPLVTNLFPQKGSYECKYEQITQTGRSTDTLYISGGKIRNEFRSMDAQGMGTLNMVVYDGKYLYSWIEGQSKGTVSEPRSLKDIPVVVPTDIHEGKVLGSGINNVSWDCHAWSPVSSLLAKPTYLKF